MTCDLLYFICCMELVDTKETVDTETATRHVDAENGQTTRQGGTNRALWEGRVEVGRL